MNYKTFKITSTDGNYTKKKLSYDEAIILQNDKKSVYYLGIIK